MDAVISGRAGRALLLDGKSLQSFDTDDPSKLVPRRQSDLPYLFGETQDLRIIENINLESARQELNHECNCNWSLDLTLISLDAELPDEIRAEALEGLDELLFDGRVAERLENILYARPLPEDADLAGALKLCDWGHQQNAFALLQIFQEQQSLISEVSAAWDAIPTKIFGGYEQQTEFQHVAVREGLFRTLVTRDTQSTVAAFLLKAGLNNSIKQLPNYRQVLQQWVTPFRQQSVTPKVVHEVAEEFETETSQRRRHGRRVGINRRAILGEVNKKKAIITEVIQRRDMERVRELVDELVNYQLSSSESEHAAKSLCDLAMLAKELGMFPLQLELTERSINVAPGDGWSWTQYGDALLNMQRLDKALKAYQQAEAFGAGVVAKNGRAEVLKSMGKLDDALAAYNVAITEHPENDVSKRGRAEVLKAIGELNEALNAYNEIILEHPEDVIAKNGRAEVLKTMGKLDDALAAFDEIILEHPENIVAKTGRAEVFKTMGKLDDALAAYNVAITEHPENVIAKNGRAEVLKTMGKLDDALAAFDEIILEHPEDVIAKNGRAEVLKTMGKLDDALAAYNVAITEHPENDVSKRGRSCVLAALGRYDEALRFLPDKSPVALEDWIGYHIRGMILLRIGKVREAIRIFNEGVQNDPSPSSKEYFRSALAVAWLRGSDYKKAVQALEEVKSPLLQAPANVLRLHAFGAQGDLQRATVAYDSLGAAPQFRSSELTQELRHQYILGQAPRHDEDWIFDREVKVILLAA
ncbi:MAG TPA: tetratricopeptide repeat protein [Pyrinomonadaceae bacterium]|jgi:tetratricopeptide (TPR) repeat protein